MKLNLLTLGMVLMLAIAGVACGDDDGMTAGSGGAGSGGSGGTGGGNIDGGDADGG